MGDSNRLKLGFIEETTWSETPEAQRQLVHVTSESLEAETEDKESTTINSNRQIKDVIRVRENGSGSLEFELIYGNMDKLFEGAMAGNWTAALSLTSDAISAAASDNSLNGTGVFASFGVVANQWIKLTIPSGTKAGTHFVKVVSKTDDKIIIAGLTLEDVNAGTDFILGSGGMLRNGTTKKSYTIEKEFSDIAQFFKYQGARLSSLQFNFNEGEIIKGSLSMMSKNEVNSSSAMAIGGDVEAPSNGLMSASDDANVVFEDGAVSSDTYESSSFTLDNGLRYRRGTGSKYPTEIDYGTCRVTGSASIFFEDATTYNKFKNQTRMAVARVAQDSAGNAYIFSMHTVAVKSPKIQAGGLDSSVMCQTELQPISGTQEYTFQIDRFPVA